MGTRGLEARGLRVSEMTPAAAPRLQRFLEANPDYFRIVNGEDPGPDEARELLASVPPPEFTWKRVWRLDFADERGEMVAMASGLCDLLAEGVWHIGLLIVATRLHGSGIAGDVLDHLESWARGSGARWMRLGVVAGNARAERFWEKRGYVEVRRRLGVEMGRRKNDLRVMVKPLDGEAISGYLALVPRDRPETR